MSILYSRQTNATYETFEAECPVCERWNILNRATDLKGARNIDFRKVTCVGCGSVFAINGDSADPPFAQMFFSAYFMMDERRYGDAVVAITRAYEMFFAHYLEECLAWKPFLTNRCDDDLNALNATLEACRQTAESWAFVKMRKVFVNVVLHGQVQNLSEGAALVADLKSFLREPDETAIAGVPNVELRTALAMLVASNVCKRRNQVVHKTGLRPTASQATAVFEEARGVIWTLADELDVRFESCPALSVDDDGDLG